MDRLDPGRFALLISLAACGGATTDNPGGTAAGADGASVDAAVDAPADVGGAGGMDGDANAGCQCPGTNGTVHCGTAQEICSLLEMPKCPTTVADVLANENVNWAEVGCGKRMLAHYSGTADGMTYLFDVATGELLGGVRYSDTIWGPCRDAGAGSYSFGDAPLPGYNGGLDCASVQKCGPLFGTGGTPVSDCLASPSDAGRDADAQD